ncbi:MAG: hypothetical protein A2015_06045 [Spirochaetes bacterium GWF1_31_7]|nr:MAG: hypothetical protein A2Y30_07665 [Spirochaetes bacterium GWE1_32_154]OHD50818.1 MAG: hypothetical protein A2Y29_02675 [Spirochaetes bacterium GWE2_31_10]OHD52755.1 MAG: hypothetical protein A2015_06045 [Spirochaetes bacterium GWF1_31_7]HBD95431.1 hypothetical protein [Spirochaetia bacterium]HBI36305.1 hypothetical protein [Spirochaetia bacterium]
MPESSLLRKSDGFNKLYDAYQKTLLNWPVKYTSRTITSSEGETHIIESGHHNKNPLLLMHGMATNSLIWLKNIEQLSEHFHVYAIDNMFDGIGLSSPAITAYKNRSSTRYINWVENIANELKLDTFNIMGTSSGGWLSLYIGYHLQDRVSKICALNPAFGLVKPVKLQFSLKTLHLVTFPTKKNILNYFRYCSHPSCEDQDDDTINLVHTALKYQKPAMPINYHHFTDEELTKINKPVFITYGDNESAVNVHKALERAKKYIPDVQLKIIENAGHSLFFDQPANINKLCIDFLNEHHT